MPFSSTIRSLLLDRILNNLHYWSPELNEITMTEKINHQIHSTILKPTERKGKIQAKDFIKETVFVENSAPNSNQSENDSTELLLSNRGLQILILLF